MGSCCSKTDSGDGLKVSATSRFRQEALEAHNIRRARHGVPPLQLNSSLNRTAQQWAKKTAKQESLQHRPNSKYGENIWMRRSTAAEPVTGADPVEAWYSEHGKYSHATASSGAAGHFSQVVWKGSTNLGIGYALSKDKHAIYVVANYDPPGNVHGQYADNVVIRC